MDDLQPGGPSITTRQKAQHRPTWTGAETFEQFDDVSSSVAQILTVPAGCTGVTVCSRNPAITTALYILPTGSSTGGPRMIIEGGVSARKHVYLAFEAASPPPIHLLSESITGADADVFYHFD